VVADDRGQQRRAGAGLHQIADRDLGAARAAGDRRPDMGVFEIDLRPFQFRVGAFEARIGDAARIGPLVIDALRDGLGLDQGGGALEFDLSEAGIGLRRGEVGARRATAAS